jgi:hypothetical protein
MRRWKDKERSGRRGRGMRILDEEKIAFGEEFNVLFF